MIQRAQTLYLLLALICITLLLVFPVFSIEVTPEIGDFTFTGEFGKNGVSGTGLEKGSFPVYIAYIVLALFSIAGIMLYKNRPKQLLVARLNLILHVLVVLGVYVFYYFGKGMVEQGIQAQAGEEVSVVFYMQAGFFLLIPALAFVYLAIRGIKTGSKFS